MIQIIAGEFRNRRINSPKGLKTRPTTSQVRAAVFNICQNEIEGASFLDICAGSGSMGIEALSRGALDACFIDHDRYALMSIRDNLKLFGITERATVCIGDAQIALHRLEKMQKSFQICYFDPPYTREGSLNHLVVDVLHFLDKSPVLKADAILFLEESAYFSLDTLALANLTLQSKRHFGESFLYCFRKS